MDSAESVSITLRITHFLTRNLCLFVVPCVAGNDEPAQFSPFPNCVGNDVGSNGGCFNGYFVRACRVISTDLTKNCAAGEISGPNNFKYTWNSNLINPMGLGSALGRCGCDYKTVPITDCKCPSG